MLLNILFKQLTQDSIYENTKRVEEIGKKERKKERRESYKERALEREL